MDKTEWYEKHTELCNNHSNLLEDGNEKMKNGTISLSNMIVHLHKLIDSAELLNDLYKSVDSPLAYEMDIEIQSYKQKILLVEKKLSEKS